MSRLADWFARNFGDAPSLAPLPREQVEAMEKLWRSRAEAARPRLVPREAPTRDEFDAWRDEPVTQFVMGALARNAEECRESWMQLSWGGGVADQRTLDALRERSDALLGFTADYEAFCETLEVEPEGSNDAA